MVARGLAARPDAAAKILLAVALFGGVLLVAFWPILEYVLLHKPLGMTLYNAAGMGINYFQFGVMRRALAGSVAHLLSSDLWTSVLLFYVVTITSFSVVACVISSKVDRPGLVWVAYAVILLDLVAFWHFDIGRTDVLIATLCALAGLSVRAGRLVLACVFVSVGLAAHELGFICGLPIIVALGLAWYREQRPSRRQIVAATAILALAAVFYLSADSLPHSARSAVVATIRSELPSTRQVDGALYYALAGSRSLAAGMCVNAKDPNHLRYLFQASLMLAVACVALAGRCLAAWLFVLLASVPPFVFLWVIGHDMERWVIMSLVAAWIVSALLPPRYVDPGRSAAWVRVLAAVVLFGLTYQGSFFEPFPRVASPVLQRISDELGLPPPPPANIEYCDPDWLQALTD